MKEIIANCIGLYISDKDSEDVENILDKKVEEGVGAAPPEFSDSII
jgi:hypothetical protein